MTFVSGWNPEHGKRGAEVAQESGLLTEKPFLLSAADVAPKAMSLSKFRKRHLEQKQAGTCWVHGPTFAVEIHTSWMTQYTYFPLCRRLTGWQGKALEGGGNPTNGGSGSSAFVAMSNVPNKGVGTCDESLLPYTDDSRALGTRPPASVFAAAAPFRVTSIADVPDDDAARDYIAHGHPSTPGIWWPGSWERDRGDGLVQTLGGGGYGHELCEIGYAAPGTFDDDHWYFELENWHGLIYNPLPEHFASRVTGYAPTTPTQASSFWVRDDCYDAVKNKGSFERTTFAGVLGWNETLVFDYTQW